VLLVAPNEDLLLRTRHQLRTPHRSLRRILHGHGASRVEETRQRKHRRHLLPVVMVLGVLPHRDSLCERVADHEDAEQQHGSNRAEIPPRAACGGVE